MALKDILRRGVNWLGQRRADNFQDTAPTPVYIVGADGAGTTSKGPTAWTPYDVTGYPPAKTAILYPSGGTVLLELPIGATSIPSKVVGSVYKPAAATIQIGAVVLPASAQDTVIPIWHFSATTVTVGVASCYAVYAVWDNQTVTVVAR